MQSLQPFSHTITCKHFNFELVIFLRHLSLTNCFVLRGLFVALNCCKARNPRADKPRSVAESALRGLFEVVFLFGLLWP